MRHVSHIFGRFAHQLAELYEAGWKTMKNEPLTGDEDTSVEGLAYRLRLLIGSRSTRSVAKAWDLSYSTLNNYLNRGTEPSLSMAKKIADREGVSVEWLASGVHKEPPALLTDNGATTGENRPTKDPLEFAWSMVFNSLDKNEVEALLKVIHKEGVKGILHDSLLQSDFEQQLYSLSTSQRERFYAQASSLMDEIKHSYGTKDE
jgi:transcriptional regulator with XRE-family HTH domain